MHARVLQQQQYSIIKQHHVLSPKPLKARHTVLRRGEQTSAAASTPTLPSSRKIVLCISDSDAAGMCLVLLLLSHAGVLHASQDKQH